MWVPGLGVYLMREAIRCNQMQTEAISGNQWQSVAIRGNQWQYVAIRGTQRLRGNQRQSEVPGLGVYVVGSVYSSAGIVAIDRQYNVPKVT
jgi:hypothetical protein